MTKRTGLVLLVAGMVLVLAGAAQVLAAQGERPVLRSDLAIEKYRHDLSDTIAVTYSLTNTTAESIFVLRWQTPVDGIDADLFAVERDGAAVEYQGRLVKRPAPTPEDYLEIGAGETLNVVFDPSAAYDMSATGQYTVRVRASLSDVLVPTKNQVSVLGAKDTFRPVTVGLESNSVTLWVEGRVRDVAEPDLGMGIYKRPGGGGGTSGYVSCSNTQISTLTTAKANALSFSTKAGNWLVANPSGGTLYTQWFGTYASNRFSTVKSHYASITDAFANKPVTINCGCNQNYYAYVYPNQPYIIYVCRVFWQAPATGRDSKAGTLVHEMSHFNVTAGTDDYVYGATGAANLAKTNPDQAIDNADNHEYFAEDQK